MPRDSHSPIEGGTEGRSGSVVETLRTIIVEELDIGRSAAEIPAEISLFEDGLALDSITLVDFIERIEKRFGFRFSDAELRPATFRSLAVLAEFVRARLGGRSGEAPDRSAPGGD